jgi:hypothetical protein
MREVEIFPGVKIPVIENNKLKDIDVEVDKALKESKTKEKDSKQEKN